MVHGVADGHFNGFDKLHEFLEGIAHTGDVEFVHTVGAHNAPLVVVAGEGAVGIFTAQPNLGQVIEATVLVDFLRIQMAMIVSQGHLAGIVVVQMLCSFSFKDKVLIHKFLHDGSSLFQNMVCPCRAGACSRQRVTEVKRWGQAPALRAYVRTSARLPGQR